MKNGVKFVVKSSGHFRALFPEERAPGIIGVPSDAPITRGRGRKRQLHFPAGDDMCTKSFQEKSLNGRMGANGGEP